MPNQSSPLVIAVLERGFVYVGNAEYDAHGNLVLYNAKNVRRWGTKAGLGQLARQGPQQETVLDTTGTVRAPRNAIVHTIDCAPEAWKS